MSNETVSLRRLRPGETLSTELSRAFDPFSERKEKMPANSASGPPKEKFIRPPVQVTASSRMEVMSDKRKKIVAIGWLVICIASIANESDRYGWGTPSLSWLILLCATWALIVWLWKWQIDLMKIKSALVSWVPKIFVTAVIAGVIFLLVWSINQPPRKPENTHLEKYMESMIQDMRVKEIEAGRAAWQANPANRPPN